MSKTLARRLDRLEEIVAPAIPLMPEDMPLAVCVRLLDETDEQVRTRVGSHRAVGETTELLIIDLYAPEEHE